MGKSRIINLVGQTYGRLKVVAGPFRIDGITWFDCYCECGNMVRVRSNKLRTGETKSCGCGRAANAKNRLMDELLNKRFGRLTVVGYNPRQRNCIVCLCDCGKEITTDRYNLLHGLVKSCGCYKRDQLANAGTHHLSHTKLHSIWGNMIQRCENKNLKSFRDYGAKGISVCEEWRDNFKCFYDWAISNGYEDGLTIDRIDSTKGYMPSNCRFISREENTSNMWATHKAEVAGMKTIPKIAEEVGVSRSTAYKRIHDAGINIAESASATVCGISYFDAVKAQFISNAIAGCC